ncbi:MAG: hypothetical protein WA364_05825 [Candidatus Nitrosopolaris sp.]
MNSKTGIAFSTTAIAAVIALFASGPIVANQQTQAFGFAGFHRGFGFHHHFFFHHPFFFHRHFFHHPSSTTTSSSTIHSSSIAISTRSTKDPKLKETLQSFFHL